VPDSHPFGQEWEQHLGTTQRAYEERRLADYLAGFSDGYHSVQLGTRWEEDKEGLEAKMVKDFARFELLRMDFWDMTPSCASATVAGCWSTGAKTS
jgi:hypothetical protein